MDNDRKRRRQVFSALCKSFGKIVPASFLRNPVIAGIDRIHPLIEGIYKPFWSNYALSIASMLRSPYSDKMHYNSDKTWWMHYSPKCGGLNIAANASLVRCMSDSEPVLVLKQVADKNASSGAAYRLLGLGFVEQFEVEYDLFRIRGVPTNRLTDYFDRPFSDDLLETALRLEALGEWQPFLQEERTPYLVNRQKRDQAFRDVVLSNYNRTCAVTGQKFVFSNTVEADAAHIIGKNSCGTDDPRNGLALSKSVHWAFDNGIFTISDQYEIIIHPKAKAASFNVFPLMAKENQRILLPSDSAYYPHQEALEWHQKERFGAFAKDRITSKE